MFVVEALGEFGPEIIENHTPQVTVKKKSVDTQNACSN